ncbi:MAG: phospholipase [Sphingomonas bacterium]|jgi:phospholipase A1|uniref:phospholipase A n=1 Tax=Sphingomonas bacterium TaxID=1895847 RepID=UPI00260EAD2B|nr:phospholipase A [Sphingomonas bacterium]MDB5704105.1 phospholipase [Sphingomonas bacterium]
MRILSLTAGAAMLALAAPAAAQLRPLVEPPASAEAAQQGVDVFLLNEGSAPVPAQGPAEIETVAKDGTRLRLIVAPDEVLTVQPGAFARLHYRLAAAAPAQAPQPIEVAQAAPPSPSEQDVADSSGTSSGFFDRFRPHEPIYGAFGLNDAGGKLQLSFAFRALGHEDGPSLNFAYTQTMFWALDKPSGPFRATNYSPELFVDLPIDPTATAGLGYRHDSNGLGTSGSIDVNRVFARVSKSFALGDGWSAELAPEAWFYVGRQGIASDLDRYWGFTSLTASIGQQDGIKLSVTGRGNPGTGKGAAEAFLSYPLAAIWSGLPHIYLFGQAFTGYGEALSDYNRRASHARLGIAFTR